MMRSAYYLVITMLIQRISSETKLDNCRFMENFYRQHSNIFHLDQNQTFLTIQPLYALPNQSFSTLSVGIIYQIEDIDLVPIPLLFQCSQNEEFYTPSDCQLTIGDIHTDFSKQISESTRLRTVPLDFRPYSSLSIRGAYFKQSMITLENCRLEIKNDHLIISTRFHLNIQFEQIINSSCEQTCLHSELYQCSSTSHTCQCRLKEFQIDNNSHLCIDTEWISNCSFTPERCQRISTNHCSSSSSFLFIILLIPSVLIIIILLISLIKIHLTKSFQSTLSINIPT